MSLQRCRRCGRVFERERLGPYCSFRCRSDMVRQRVRIWNQVTEAAKTGTMTGDQIVALLQTIPERTPDPVREEAKP